MCPDCPEAASDSWGGPPLSPVVGPADSVVAVGNASSGRAGQQAFLVKADTAGDIEPFFPADIPGGLIPEETVAGLAAAPDGTMVAVGSADDYPAIWQSSPGGAWRLVSSLALSSAAPDLNGLSAVTYGPSGWLADGGREWQPVPFTAPGAAVTFTALTAGPGGFTAAAQFGSAAGGP